MPGATALSIAVLAALLALVAPSWTPTHSAGVCAFYGECGYNPEVNVSLVASKVPCVSNTPAREATGALLTLLSSVCPDLVLGAAGAPRVCCSLAQLLALQLSVALSSAVLARCPACARNFANIHCRNICSPDQSLFINVTRAVPVQGTAEFAVVEYQCFYQQEFADAAFASCHGVRLPATGGFALDTMCGIYGAQLCTAQRWLDFQGDKSNGLAPLQIDFHLVPNGTSPGEALEPLHAQAWSCSQALSDEEQACSCQDCAESCSTITPPAGPAPRFHIGAADGALVLCSLLFALLALLFLFSLCCRHCSSKQGTTLQPAPARARGCAARWGDAGHRALARAFQWWGMLVAAHPLPVLVVAVALVAGLSSGFRALRLTTDPVELWSAPGSRARQEKAFYDQHFGPFLRTNQVIVTAPRRNGSRYDSVLFGAKNFSAVLSMEVLRAVLELQERLAATTALAPGTGRAVRLQDVCYAPLNPGSPAPADCCVNSVTQYFQNNGTHLAMVATQPHSKGTGTVDWRDHLIYCVNSPLSFKDITALELSCTADYGGPVFPYIAFGGYTDSEYTEAEALIITYSLNNFPREDPRHEWVLSWESRFLQVVGDFQRTHGHDLSVAFMAERSLEDEINRTTGEDIPIFAISYAVVFAYIALALGEYTAWRRVPVESKVTLALGGIAVVIGAVFSAMGLLALLGLPSSLIILEVVPFLILAVGADNIFIFVQEYQQSPRQPGERREHHIARVLAQVAPSLVLCSLSELICFLLGALSSMPAVRTFALTAALAIAFDFLLQISAFVALLALDARREEASRPELCCCCRRDKRPAGPGLRLLRPLLQRLVPGLLHRCVRPAMVLLFLLLACAGLYLMLQVPVGLDQELAMPKDSYMLQYFSAINQYLAVGVPTFFVTTEGYDFSSAEGINGICSSSGCDSDSLGHTVEMATRFPNASFLAIPATSWLDDFLDWLNPTGRCCRVHLFGNATGQFCPATSDDPSCVGGQCLNATRRPTPEEFQRFLPWFLQDRPTLQCAKGGLGAYDTAVSMDANGTILATRFMAYQRPLRTAQEHTAALRAARALAEELTRTLRRVPGTQPGFRVFPYTVTYVYYEQYLTVVAEGLVTLGLCLVPTFLVSFLLLGMDLRSSAATLLTIAMILVDTVGAMALWDIPYNAVALINLVAAVGVSVEFVSHLTYAFAHSRQRGRVARAADATVTMGSKVVAGVAMTNLPGIVVLAFAKAQLIQVFFFRLNLIITLLGLAHGLLFLPVLLSYMGPSPRGTPSGLTTGDVVVSTLPGPGSGQRNKEQEQEQGKVPGPRQG
ncbi:NPC1-like intracellular cholesterol transporter 1 isoform X2 [Lathamus discolor]|uniref:NPC1-like intracellular cholesterol transporter 1 isoform X2 n=1 Tax=Lathamus discolor TaxID=678569 RepID=UPI0032B74B32